MRAVILGLAAFATSFTAAHAAPRTYAIAIGNDMPPPGDDTGLALLRYADDDAVRYYQFFKSFADEVRLLAVLDTPTQKRYPTVAGLAEVPSRTNLMRIVAEMRAAMEQDRRRGTAPQFFLAFSGHGVPAADGTAALVLVDGELSQAMLYDEILAQLPAALVHVIVDACHSAAVVGLRGVSREVDAQTVPVPASHASSPARLSRFPHVGALVATTAGEQAHEWSHIESGVFTHELLSGLAGPADVNGDGKIEYSEAQAFVAAANSEVRDPRAVPHVVAQPPAINHNAPLVTLAAMRGVRLSGDASRLGHFSIELANGQRYLDAHLGDHREAALIIPDAPTSYLRAADREAELASSSGGPIRLEDLAFVERPAAARGSIDAAYRTALFAAPYGRSYYRGFVDSTGGVGVPLTDEPKAAWTNPLPAPPRQRWALASLGVGGASLLASGLMVGLMLDAKHDFDGTAVQRAAHEANERYVRYQGATVGTALVAVAGAALGYLLWPSQDDGAGGQQATDL